MSTSHSDFHWRSIQKDNFTSLAKLLDFLEFSEENRKRIHFYPHFVLNVPRRIAAKMEKNDLADPIFLQFVPLLEETFLKDGFVPDALQEAAFREKSKLIHKYESRALLLASGACAMHCRYCFRQHFPYETKIQGFEAELNYIASHSDLKEIILSGGDPLSLSNASLYDLLGSIGRIPHIRRIRFHTRFPIGIPERIDEPLLNMLAQIRQQVFFVIHCNHPKELDADITCALKKIAHLGIPLLNQSVLLKGVNDDETTFLELLEALIDARVIPYYLHLLDPVQGTAHFDVLEKRGHELIQYAQKKLSGFGIPRLVREVPGCASKTFLT